ncbi:radical SAM protein [Thermodesulfobacteriota bacterium]
MKILLIYPYFLNARLDPADISVIPIGVYYVAAVLKDHQYDVEILNWHNVHKTPEKIASTLIEKNPDVIGFSILHANRWGGIEIARIAKEVIPQAKTVFGGIGATYLWEHFLTHFKEIDFIVLGEGEYTFLNLVQTIEEKDFGHIPNIKGIAYKKGNYLVTTGMPAAIRNLDKLPVPAKYFEYQHVLLSRGCPGNCTFCGSPEFWKHKVRFHSAGYFVEQLELLNKKGVSFFYFSDDTLTLQKKRVIEICKKICEKNLRIVWQAVSQVKHVDPEILSWMRKAGCVQISYGVESGSEKIRKKLNKPITDDQIERAFRITTKYGILARAYFIYGSPGETRETIQETLDLIQKIRPLSVIFYILDIFPGTALYQDFKERFKLTDDFWLNRIEDILYFETDAQLSAEAVLDFGKRLRDYFYQNLRGYASGIELVDEKEFYPLHADFLSRIAMTFSHGDYAGIAVIKDKDRVAAELYQRALDYYPDHRAYLGLGMISQKNREFEKSIRILGKGMGHYPDSEQLNLCAGINYMNLGRFDKALSYLLKIKNSKKAVDYITECYKALGQTDKAEDLLKKP